MAEVESNVETDRSQEQVKTEDMWNEWPRLHEQRLLVVAQREKVFRDQLIQRLQAGTETNQKIKEILRARNPFKLLPDPPQPYASLPVKIVE